MISIQTATDMSKPTGADEPTAPVEPGAPEPDLEANPAPQSSAKPIPRIWIPAVLSVGLLIAAVYLGGRIVSAHSQTSIHRVARPAIAQVAPQPSITPVPVTQPKPEVKPEPKPETPAVSEPAAATPAIAADEQIPKITPKPGERYIQVGALDLKLTLRYIPRLEQAKFEPHVAPGPTPDLLRVLIGPFPDRDSLNAVKSELDSAGIDNFVRQY